MTAGIRVYLHRANCTYVCKKESRDKIIRLWQSKCMSLFLFFPSSLSLSNVNWHFSLFVINYMRAAKHCQKHKSSDCKWNRMCIWFHKDRARRTHAQTRNMKNEPIFFLFGSCNAQYFWCHHLLRVNPNFVTSCQNRNAPQSYCIAMCFHKMFFFLEFESFIFYIPILIMFGDELSHLGSEC